MTQNGSSSDSSVDLRGRSQSDAIELCKRDKFYFLSTFVQTMDEEEKCIRQYPEYPYLRDYVVPNIEAPGNRLWEKTQRMLLTITFCGMFLGSWMMDPFFLGFMTSKNKNAVDDGGGNSTWNSLFGKMRSMYDSIYRRAPWLLEHFLGTAIPSYLLFKHMVLENPKSGNVIIGSAPTSNAAMGGGYTKALVDETADVENMVSIHGNLTQACKHGTHYVSFPNGRANWFAKVRFEEPSHYGFEIMTVPYTMYPGRDRAWRDRVAATMTPTEAARRLDISYDESTEARVFPNFKRTTNCLPSIPFDVDDLELWWDFGSRNATAVIFSSVALEEIGDGVLDYVVKLVWGLEFWNTNSREVGEGVRNQLLDMGFIPSRKVAEDEDAFRSSFTRFKMVGDPQVNAVGIASGITIKSSYQTEGFNIDGAQRHDIPTVLDWIDGMFKQNRIWVNGKCGVLTKALEGGCWPKNPDGSRKAGQTNIDGDNIFSHTIKAVEYGMTEYVNRMILRAKDEQSRAKAPVAGERRKVARKRFAVQ